MLWAAVAYGVGIVAGVHAWRPALWWALAGILFILAAAYFPRRRPPLGWALGIGVFFLAGAFHVQARSSFSRLDASIQPNVDKLLK